MSVNNLEFKKGNVGVSASINVALLKSILFKYINNELDDEYGNLDNIQDKFLEEINLRIQEIIRIRSY